MACLFVRVIFFLLCPETYGHSINDTKFILIYKKSIAICLFL